MDIKLARFLALAAIALPAAGLAGTRGSKGAKNGSENRVIYWKDDSGLNRSITPRNLFETMREANMGSRSLLSKVVPGDTMHRQQRALLALVKKMAGDLKRDPAGLAGADLAQVCANARPVYTMLNQLEGQRKIFQRLLAGETNVDEAANPDDPFAKDREQFVLGPDNELLKSFEKYQHMFKQLVELDGAYRREVERLVYGLPHDGKVPVAGNGGAKGHALVLDPSGYSWTPNKPVTVVGSGQPWVAELAATAAAEQRVVSGSAGKLRALPMLEKIGMKPIWLREKSWTKPAILLLHPSGDASKNVLLQLDESGTPLINAQTAEKRAVRSAAESMDLMTLDGSALATSRSGRRTFQVTVVPARGDGYISVRARGNGEQKVLQVSDLSNTDPTRSMIYDLESRTVVSPGQLDERALLPEEESRAKTIAARTLDKQHETSELAGLFLLLEATSY